MPGAVAAVAADRRPPGSPRYALDRAAGRHRSGPRAGGPRHVRRPCRPRPRGRRAAGLRHGAGAGPFLRAVRTARRLHPRPHHRPPAPAYRARRTAGGGPDGHPLRRPDRPGVRPDRPRHRRRRDPRLLRADLPRRPPAVPAARPHARLHRRRERARHAPSPVRDTAVDRGGKLGGHRRRPGSAGPDQRHGRLRRTAVHRRVPRAHLGAVHASPAWRWPGSTSPGPGSAPNSPSSAARWPCSATVAPGWPSASSRTRRPPSPPPPTAIRPPRPGGPTPSATSSTTPRRPGSWWPHRTARRPSPSSATPVSRCWSWSCASPPWTGSRDWAASPPPSARSA